MSVSLGVNLKILTFNHHESYLVSLSEVGHEFDVVIGRGDLDLAWNTRARPVPSNFRLVELDNAIKGKLRQGYYDVVICHTIKNLIWMWLFFKPRYIFVAHIPLFKHSATARFKSRVKKMLWVLFRLTHDAQFFAVSQFKQKSWQEEGLCAVLSPGQFPPLRQLDEPSQILIICNHLHERGEELGLNMLERIKNRLPIRTVGRNPGIEFNIEPRDFAHFQELVTGFHIYLYTIKLPWGDGYNTAMLEAMRMGMAIVTVRHPTSPIIHGVNGLVADNEEQLIQHIERLRSDPDLIKRLGAAATATVERDFSQTRFLETWRTLIAG
jgi:hypothetical protein